MTSSKSKKKEIECQLKYLEIEKNNTLNSLKKTVSSIESRLKKSELKIKNWKNNLKTNQNQTQTPQ